MLWRWIARDGTTWSRPSTEEGRRVYVCAVAVGMDLTDHDELEMRTSPTREATQDGQVGA